MKNFTNLSTRSKLLLSFGLIMVMFLAVIFIAYSNIQKITQSEKRLHDIHFVIALEINELRSHQNHNRADILAMMLTKDKSEQLVLENGMNQRSDTINKLVLILSKIDTDPLFLNRLNDLRNNIQAYQNGRFIEIGLIKEGKIEEASQAGTGIQAERYEKIRSLSYEMSNQAKIDADKQLTIDMKNSRTSTLLFILFGTIALFFSLIIVVVMNRTMAQPLNDLTNVASRIASGDLKVEVKTKDRKDEIGVLSQAFDQMVSYLRQFINDINEVVNVLASSSTEILAATTQVATGTSETAAAISETSTTVEEVQQASKLSSQKAKNVADSAQRVVQVFQNGQKSVDETINGMNRIREQMDSIAQTVVRLSEQSQSIGGIIASVTDIADQSNLLAVNAAIEAAKAGEQGRGFAVVAQEIKNLAGQSKQATLQVRNILNDIQKVTGAAVMATEQGSKAVESGLKQSMQAGEAIRILAESSNEAVQAATQIVASSQQQVVGMDQIGIAMQNINQAGTETAVSMIQAEKSAKSLYELGQKLKGMVEKFKG